MLTTPSIEAIVDQNIVTDLLLIYKPDGQLVDVNQTFLDKLGYSRDQLASLAVKDIEVGWTSEKITELSQPLQLGIPTNYVASYNHINSEPLSVEIYLSLIESDNQPYFLALARDLTSIETLERRVQTQTLELERLNEELKAFSYSVSHDLRAPLRAIHGFAEIIARRYGDEFNEEAQHFLNNILAASTHMDQLINDLLTYSRLGHRAARYQLVNLENLLNQVLLTLSSQIEKTQAQIDLPAQMPTIQTDPALLYQILINLIENAIIYHRPDLTAHVSIICRKEASQISIGVADNGLGIPVQYHTKIFNIFQKLHHQTLYEGNGIGLSLVKKAVTLLNGKIRIDSVEEQGTTFWVTLPYPLSDLKSNQADK